MHTGQLHRTQARATWVSSVLLLSPDSGRRPCPSSRNTQGKTCTLPPGEWLFYTSCQGRTRRPRGRTWRPCGLFSSQLHRHFRSCRTDCVFKKLLFHSDQLKEIKLRCPLLTDCDLQVRAGGVPSWLQPCCHGVADS